MFFRDFANMPLAIKRSASEEAFVASDVLLSKQEAPTLERQRSTPTEGDHSLRTEEAFITVRELSGASHELGWFTPKATVGEVKRRLSEDMCIPAEALSIASTSSRSNPSFSVDETPLGDVFSPFVPGAELNVVVAFPDHFQEALNCLDDIRECQKAYSKLVAFAREFEGTCMTLANANMLNRVVREISGRLRKSAHPTNRGWAIQALSDLSEHSIKQFSLCQDARVSDECAESLKSTLECLTAIFEELSQTSCSWLEKQEAADALAKMQVVSRARRGGA